jgi:hypothetical protein
MAATMSLSTSHNTTPPPQFTPLEQELLAEYQKLVTNMNTVLPPPLGFLGRVVDGVGVGVDCGDGGTAYVADFGCVEVA